jgi:predicted nucleic acid-binding protein
VACTDAYRAARLPLATTASVLTELLYFADATLVHVAEREGLRTILTIDHADFETYRIGRNAKFRILPAR